MKPSEIREKTDAELVKLSRELEDELFKLNFRKGAGQLKQTASIKKQKRIVARVKTILNERTLEQEK